VLGGGGARGFAHPGVIRALHEAGVPIDLIGGTSMGAFMAMGYALGLTPDEMVERGLKATEHLMDLTVPIVSLIAAKRMARRLTTELGDLQIEDLHLPYFAVSANLSRAEVMVHARGSLVKAVQASNSAPALFPPVIMDGDLLMDGALLDNVPVDVMRRFANGGTVIAVDVSPPGHGRQYGPGHRCVGLEAVVEQAQPARRSDQAAQHGRHRDPRH
jgi:predicted acylesterase/phospholipase RssA